MPVAAAAINAWSLGSSPATTRTSSAPIHGGTSAATTNGAAIDGDPVEVVEGVDAAGERLEHDVHALRGVGDGVVELSGRLVALVVGHQLREWPILFTEGGQHVQRGQHAGVGAPKVAEVVM